MSLQDMRILFTSAGRRAGLMQCFRDAAEALGIRADIHACDLRPDLSSACQLADTSFAVPRCTDSACIEALLSHCREFGIDLVIPTIDTELAILAENRERFERIGTHVHVANPDLIAIVRDKLLTIETLAAAGVPVPRTAPVEMAGAVPQDWDWPLFAKPNGGSASRGIEILTAPRDIRRSYDEPMLAQQLLKGEEYTVNIYVGADGSLLAAIPHLRLAVRGGEVDKGRTVRDFRFHEIAENLVAALPQPRGVMCFQLIDDVQRGPCVFEINARFGGGYPLADHAGGRFAESLLAERLGKPACASNEWREGVEMIRYDAAVYRG